MPLAAFVGGECEFELTDSRGNFCNVAPFPEAVTLSRSELGLLLGAVHQREFYFLGWCSARGHHFSDKL
jgi:hypothetical protein